MEKHTLYGIIVILVVTLILICVSHRKNMAALRKNRDAKASLLHCWRSLHAGNYWDAVVECCVMPAVTDTVFGRVAVDGAKIVLEHIQKFDIVKHGDTHRCYPVQELESHLSKIEEGLYPLTIPSTLQVFMKDYIRQDIVKWVKQDNANAEKIGQIYQKATALGYKKTTNLIHDCLITTGVLRPEMYVGAGTHSS